jgi:spore coat polysaccharide biosynthesis protein SpsF (cytidylyltransferase family)
MNQNTFGKTKAANDLVLHLETENVWKKTISKISLKITDYNRGLNVIIGIEDNKIRASLLKMWTETSLEAMNNIDVSNNIISHLKNVQLAYLKRKAYKK